MNMFFRFGWLSGFLLASSVAGVSQSTANVPMPAVGVPMVQLGGFVGGGAVGAFVNGGNPFQAVVGRPYSAEQISEHVQTLADGTHISQTAMKVMLYRDSLGRTRTDRQLLSPPGLVMASRPALVEIIDPVAGFHYILDESNHVARRRPWLPMMNRVNPAAAAVNGNAGAPSLLTATAPNPGPAPSARLSRPRPDLHHESLGSQNIDGILAEGTRTTITYPEGMVGNDRPITTVSESWTSPDLKIEILSKRSDPRNGESSTKLTNLVQSEPDPALFQIPADYTITDEQQPGAVVR